MTKTKSLKQTVVGSSHVRFTSNEYKKISNEAQRSNKSIPTLLKEAYFNQLPRTVLVDEQGLNVLRCDLKRIGNNLNQIARKLNSGILKGWNNSLELIFDELKALKEQIHFGYGLHKN